jgi:hypothetical protein
MRTSNPTLTFKIRNEAIREEAEVGERMKDQRDGK